MDIARQASVPTHPAGNVPTDPDNLQRLEAARRSAKEDDRGVGEDLSRWLLKISNDITDLDREKRLRLFRQMIKAHQFLDGNFYGYVDHNLDWRTRDRTDGEIWYQDNQLYAYIRSALMELARSQTQIAVTAPPGSAEKLALAAKFAQMRVDYNRARCVNARLRQTEAMYALLNGITFRYTFPQFSAAGERSEKIPVLQQQEAEVSGVKVCANCAHKMVEDEGINEEPAEPKCPSCGSLVYNEYEMSGGPEAQIGYEDVPTCSNAYIVPNPIGIIVSMQASCIEESPFLKWNLPVLRGVLEAKFPGIKIESTGMPTVELRYIKDRQTATPGDFSASATLDATGSIDGTTSDAAELELIEFSQIWLDPPLLNIKFDKDMPLGKGEVLPAGTPLVERFPKGLYFAHAGDIVLDIWNEDKNRKWTSSPYGVRPGSMYGSGSFAALADQELINDLVTLQMANAWANGVPKEFVDPSFIEELSADPQIPTNITQPITTGRIIGTAWEAAPAQPLSPDIYGLNDAAKSAMQNKIGAMSGQGAGGLADAQKWGDTATAISIKRDLAVGRFGPDLELMADQLDLLQAKQFVQNEQEFYTPEQWQKHLGEYGEDALQAFLECDPCEDLVWTVLPGSWMPKTDAQVQAKLIGFLEMLPTLIQIQNPEILAHVAEVFGVPEGLVGWASDKNYVARLVSRFTELADELIETTGDAPTNDINDPRVAQAAQAINDWAGMPVDIFLDNHQAIMDALVDWRATDAGRSASNVLLAALDMRFLTHKQAVVEQRQMMAAEEVAAAAPMEAKMKEDQAAMMEAEDAKQQQMMAAQQEADMAAQEQAAADKEQDIAMQIADRIMSDEDAKEQREHELTTKAMDQTHQTILEDRKALAAAQSSEKAGTAGKTKKGE